MMRRAGAALLALALSAPTPAQAVISVEDVVIQHGNFRKPGCTPDPRDPVYDGCLCESDLHAPRIGGLMDVAAQAGLNAHFTDEAGAAHCEGDETETSQPEKEPQPGNGKTREGATLTARYETTFQSESLLAFKFMHFDYAGGAHGDGALYGAIIDVDKGRLLGPAELFSPEHLKAANRFIYEALSARPEGEIFRDQIEAKKDSFLHDRVCEGCSLVLLPGGLHVVFQTYEVASFAEGNIDIALPANLVDYPSVRAALPDVP